MSKNSKKNETAPDLDQIFGASSKDDEKIENNDETPVIGEATADDAQPETTLEEVKEEKEKAPDKNQAEEKGETTKDNQTEAAKEEVTDDAHSEMQEGTEPVVLKGSTNNTHAGYSPMVWMTKMK